MTNRMEETKCRLCLVESADKRNSHIIPKFFKTGLFGPKNDIRGYRVSTINPTEKPRKVQDIPKEDNIFCSKCEKKLSALETYFANNLYNLLHKRSRKYKVEKLINKRIMYSNKVNANLINLLLQSILWRQHISNHNKMANFSIDESDVVIIRRQLEKILAISKKEMLENMLNYQSDFTFFPYIMWTHLNKRRDDNFIVALPGQTGRYLLVLNALRLHISSSDDFFRKQLKELNHNDEKVSILLIDNRNWQMETIDILSHAMNYTWSI